MPRPILYILLVLVAASLIPIGLIYKARHERKSKPRIQVVYDMDDQFSYKPQTVNGFFADGQAMRKHPEGSVARGHLQADDPYYRGTVPGDTLYVAEFPVQLTRQYLDRGQERFNIYCAPCHGVAGDGDGLVNRRAAALAEGTWTPPTDLTSQTVIERPVGHLYNTITNGIRNMPAYGPQIPVDDRWAIVAYVRALQLSRNASIDDVPADVRTTLEK